MQLSHPLDKNIHIKIQNKPVIPNLYSEVYIDLEESLQNIIDDLSECAEKGFYTHMVSGDDLVLRRDFTQEEKDAHIASYKSGLEEWNKAYHAGLVELESRYQASILNGMNSEEYVKFLKEITQESGQ